MKPDQLFMVFDVESIGLHGEGFAVGYVVIDANGDERGSGMYACPPIRAAGDQDGRAWVAENVPALPIEFQTPRAMRTRFWIDWWFWKGQGAILVADCAWPVEARFLIAGVDDDPDHRTWEGPYPLHELASFMVAAGMDPMAEYPRLPGEEKHHPLGDARQSARLLLVALAAATTTAPAAENDAAAAETGTGE